MIDSAIINNRDKVSVILPACNEAGNLEVLLDKVYRTFRQGAIYGEAVLINDGSTDGTGSVARECARKYPFLRVIEQESNLGLTKTLMNGFRIATGDIIIFLCSDLQSDPEEDIPKLLRGIDNGADVVVGWRQKRKGFRAFGSKVYNFSSRVLFNTKVHDQNWIKAFRKEAAQSLALKSDWHRYIIPIAAYKGFKISEVKTNWYPRRFGRSKYGFMRIPVAILDMFLLKIEMSFFWKPNVVFNLFPKKT